MLAVPLVVGPLLLAHWARAQTSAGLRCSSQAFTGAGYVLKQADTGRISNLRLCCKREAGNMGAGQLIVQWSTGRSTAHACSNNVPGRAAQCCYDLYNTASAMPQRIKLTAHASVLLCALQVSWVCQIHQAQRVANNTHYHACCVHSWHALTLHGMILAKVPCTLHPVCRTTKMPAPSAMQATFWSALSQTSCKAWAVLLQREAGQASMTPVEHTSSGQPKLQWSAQKHNRSAQRLEARSSISCRRALMALATCLLMPRSTFACCIHHKAAVAQSPGLHSYPLHVVSSVSNHRALCGNTCSRTSDQRNA